MAKKPFERLDVGDTVPVLNLTMGKYQVLRKQLDGWHTLMDLDAAAVKEHGPESDVIVEALRDLIKLAPDRAALDCIMGWFTDDCYFVSMEAIH